MSPVDATVGGCATDSDEGIVIGDSWGKKVMEKLNLQLRLKHVVP
jgi:hypothetical protein